ncbi:diguanylate cyclase [Halomonas sp. McH1-25]|uniref:diguanylate cyclase domain-containing protein n=1 Tax=unclassified Halomonas TaxID=2609666 RepID=UPI001EF74B91|nr:MULTISPECIES: diguanylate cyclase [unclassified Halomonas]MCG7599965.1 diguanylate cyclase [Halomonas sp. McH1-25]MCP1343376.1 diguanylate cyclase [Halomonas sp. FL8]MCP1360467.1 diguanylate cyclase [Halomonas sp. BBD45]MCP1363857.1 diguanylate cyclase [Halomonas sp. BBD48]
MLRRLSLGNRLALASAGLVISAIALLGWAISHEVEDHLHDLIGSSLAETAYQMADKLDRSMAARVHEVQLLQDVHALTAEIDHAHMRELIEQLQASYEVASWIGITDPAGTVIAATDGLLEGNNIAHRPVFLQGRQALWVGDVHEAVMLAQLLPNPSGEAIKFVDVAAPLYGEDGEFAGVLAVHLSWAWAEKLKASMLSPREKSQDIEVVVVSSDGTVLLGPHDLLGAPLTSLASEGTFGSIGSDWSVETWPDGKDYLTGQASSDGEGVFPGLGWTVLTRRPVEAAFAPLRTLQVEIAVGGLIVALFVALAGWGMLSRLSAPLARLSRAADEVRKGAGANTIPLELSSPELARLSRSLRSMVGQILNQRQAIDELQDIANADPLTGLPNRAYLTRHLEQRLGKARQLQRSIAFLYMDLDGFKRVNDTYGHYAGDWLLIEVAKRLRDCLRGEDVAIRFGGDEFVLIVEADSDKARWLVQMVGKRVIQAVSAPVMLPDGQQVSVGASIGVALWPEQAETPDEVMAFADSALYAAKAAGKGRIFLYGSEGQTQALT